MSACAGCHRHTFVLRVVDGAKLCDNCSDKSALIDRKLARVCSNDPVDCDDCGDAVEFDARVAVVVRQCGGAVLCDFCKPTAIDRRAT